MTGIGERAFERLNITGATIPYGVESIGEDAFDNFHGTLTLSVKQGSYAEQYAQENEIPYVLVSK